MPSKYAACAVLGLVLVLGAGTARANGRFPAADQLVVFPSAPDRLVLRTTFGILFSHDRGKTWDWVCERAIGYGGREDPALGIVGETVLAGTFSGLSITQDLGCTWAFAGGGLKSQVVIDVSARPGQPSAALALTSTYVLEDAGVDAGLRYVNDLYATTDAGKTWNRHGVGLPSYAIAETVDTAPSNATRIYASAYRRKGDGNEGLFYTSDNDGASFAETVVELRQNEGAPFIAAIDPVDAGRIYVRTTASAASRLLVSDDAGKTFRTVFTGPPLLGFALSRDGSKVWIGNSDGLYAASRQDLAFTKRANIAVQCLTLSGETLYACSGESSGFIVGASTDEGATFTPLLHLATVRGPLACPSGTPTATCVLEWPNIRAQLGGDVTDAGSDANPDGGQPAAPPSDSEGGCSVPAGKSGSAALVVMGAMAAVAWIFRRASRRHS